MRIFLTAVLFATVSLSAAPPYASEQALPVTHVDSPRIQVDAVAQAIEDAYFDPKQAKAWADALRQDASRGDFDAFTDRSLLSQRLTDRLQTLDRHLRVRPVTTPERIPAMAAQPRARDEHERTERIAGQAPMPPRMRPRMRPVTPGQPAPMRAPRERHGHAPREADDAAGIGEVRMLDAGIGYLRLEEFADFDPARADAPARTALDAGLLRLAVS